MSCSSNDSSKMKRQATDQEKIYAEHISKKRLEARVNVEFLQFIN